MLKSTILSVLSNFSSPSTVRPSNHNQCTFFFGLFGNLGQGRGTAHTDQSVKVCSNHANITIYNIYFKYLVRSTTTDITRGLIPTLYLEIVSVPSLQLQLSNVHVMLQQECEGSQGLWEHEDEVRRISSSCSRRNKHT